MPLREAVRKAVAEGNAWLLIALAAMVSAALVTNGLLINMSLRVFEQTVNAAADQSVENFRAIKDLSELLIEEKARRENADRARELDSRGNPP